MNLNTVKSYFADLKFLAETEAWKYSSVRSFADREWTLSPVEPLLESARYLRDCWSQDFDVLITMNGRWLQSESVCRATEVQISEQTLSAEFPVQSLMLRVPEKKTVTRPLLIIHAQSSGVHWSVARTRLELGENSELHLAEWFLGGDQGLRSHHMDVVQHPNSRLHWTRTVRLDLECRLLSFSQTELGENAQLNFGLVQGGTSWTRSEWSVDVRGSGAEAHVSGLNFGRQQQHGDQRVVVNHWTADTSSSQLFKGILKDRARGVLNGRIFIAPDAQRVNSSQMNHNLILSAGAEADTKPELEIFADDVKANHGATVGRMDDNKLFYLMSRGVQRAEAQKILARAFVADVLMKVGPQPLRRLMENAIEEILPDFSHQMELKQ